MSSPILLGSDSGSTTEDDDETIEILPTPPSVRDQTIADDVPNSPEILEVDDGDDTDDLRPSNPVPPHSPTILGGAGADVMHREGAVAPNINIRDDPGGGRGHIGVPGTSSSLNTSHAEFRSPKKYKPKSPVKSPAAAATNVDEDAAECPICFEEWSNSGEHRLASLKCGHLFGKSCIEKWLKEQKPGKCPQCKSRATKKDIRFLYAKALKMVDTTEKDQALKDLEDEKKARREAEMQAAQHRLQYQVAQAEVGRLREELERSRQQSLNRQMGAANNLMLSQAAQSSQSSSQANQARYVFDRIVKVWEAGNCRVMTYDPRSATLVVSQPSASPLFPGFGIKKINTLDFRTNQYVSIHQKMIRDVAFNPSTNDGLLLSASIDKTIKVTSMSSSIVVQTYQNPQPVWSCVWNPDSTWLFYAGQVNGAVNVFDIRNTSGMVNQINTGQGSPCVSLQYIGQDPQSTSFRPGGLLVGQLNKSIFYEHKPNDDFVPHALPMESQLTCLCLDNKSRHLLASYRPTQKSPSARHMVYQLTATSVAGTNSVCMANKVHTLHGGSTQKLLSRSKLVQHPADPDRLLVCAGDEASQSINVWDTTTGNLCQKLSAQSEILDFTPVPVNSEHYLAALTDKAVRLYKWSG